jgi:hypothetical protein
MTTILLDYNLAGYRKLLLSAFAANGWLELMPLQVIIFADVGFAMETADRVIWRFVQEQRYLLLTNNRNMTGPDSLEQTIREELTADSLPIITIGNLDRFKERLYREQCATRLAEIVLDLNTHLGNSRLFIP